MVGDMKVALCLHGLFDSTTDKSSSGINGYEYIKKHILDKYDTDVYIHNWNIEMQGFINDLYNPKKSIFEKQIDFNPLVVSMGLNNITNPPRSPYSVLSHFYSIQKSFSLLYENPNMEYDIVIKSRFDLGQINRKTSPYHTECIQLYSDNLDSINMANWPDNWMLNEGPPDVWFYSNYDNMRVFSHIYDYILDYMNIPNDFSDGVSKKLGIGNISNASVLYKKFLEDVNLWEGRNAIISKKN